MFHDYFTNLGGVFKMKLDQGKDYFRRKNNLKMRYVFLVIVVSTISLLQSFRVFTYIFSLMFIQLIFSIELYLLDTIKINKVSGLYTIKFKKGKDEKEYYDGSYSSDAHIWFYRKRNFLRYDIIKGIHRDSIEYFKITKEDRKK